MVKIVINTGSGFYLTHKAVMRYAELTKMKLTGYLHDHTRHWYKKYNSSDKKEEWTEQFLDYYVDTDLDIIAENDHLIENFFPLFLDRTDPSLIQVVEELKDTEQLELKIVEVPEDVKWKIEEYEMGPECVREISRVWK